MKAILINPKQKTITEIQIDGSLEGYYRALECEVFTVPTYLKNGDALYADDEGLFKEELYGTDVSAFFPGGPLVGNLLVVGTTKDGDSEDCKSTVGYVSSQIRFLGPVYLK
jgi:hypothetical protein